MKRWKKLVLFVFVLILLSQIPFAYRRYRLGRLHNAIQQLNSERDASQRSDGYNELVGVVHVHSFLGGHSTGTFDEILAAARSNKLNFVVMTEHESNHYDTAAMTLKGFYRDILFVNGNEVERQETDHVLLVPGLPPPKEGWLTDPQMGPDVPGDILTRGRGKEGLNFVAYPQEFRGWGTTYYDGIEVYNLFTNARQISPVIMFFDGLWSYRSYPDLLFADFYQRPAANLAKWDQAIVATKRRLVAIAGNDSHSNIGLTLNDETGKTLVGMKLDPYERSFRLFRMHVLLPREQELNQATLLEALGAGHCFIGFDIFGETAGFNYTATSGSDLKLQGDEIKLSGEVKLAVRTPVASRIVLLKDGGVISDDVGVNQKEYVVKQTGTYRVEVYLPQLPGPVKDQPWIISNPVYVK